MIVVFNTSLLGDTVTQYFTDYPFPGPLSNIIGEQRSRATSPHPLGTALSDDHQLPLPKNIQTSKV